MRFLLAMGFFSFQVVASQAVSILDPLVLLDQGLNVFAAQIEDIEEFSEKLRAEGVKILRTNQLDDHEPIDPTEYLAFERSIEGDPGRKLLP